MYRNQLAVRVFTLIVLSITVTLVMHACKSDDPEIPTPSISSFSPTTDITGASVTITGLNFSSNTSENVVTFNGTATTVSAATKTQLTVTVPAGATTGKIGVTVNGKSTTSSTDFIIFTPSTTLVSFTPVSGIIGSSVTITGTNFSTTPSANVVTFNSTVTPVTSATSTQLTVTVPDGATSGKIAVIVNNIEVLSAEDFMVIVPPTITAISPMTGTLGTTVTITGTNFGTTIDDNIVKFNGTSAIVTSATSTRLEVTVPLGTTTGKITVESGTQLTTSSEDFVYYLPATVTTLAGNGTTAVFESPCAVAVDGTGNVYVADWAKSAIFKITPAGVVSTFAGNGQFNYPYGVAVDGSGNVYVADRFNHRVAKITPGGVVSTLAGHSTSGFADGTGAAARFKEPIDVALDSDGNVYVADKGNQRIRKITPAGEVTTVAGSGTIGYADGNSTAAMFSNPTGLAIDADGNIYVTDNTNHRIRKITPAGVVSTLAGNGNPAHADGTGASAEFGYPAGIALDPSGNIIVGDYGDGHIRKITPEGVVTTLAGSTSGFADGTGTAAKFSGILGVDVDASNNIYVADQDNRRVRKITVE